MTPHDLPDSKRGKRAVLRVPFAPPCGERVGLRGLRWGTRAHHQPVPKHVPSIPPTARKISTVRDHGRQTVVRTGNLQPRTQVRSVGHGILLTPGSCESPTRRVGRLSTAVLRDGWAVSGEPSHEVPRSVYYGWTTAGTASSSPSSSGSSLTPPAISFTVNSRWKSPINRPQPHV